MAITCPHTLETIALRMSPPLMADTGSFHYKTNDGRFPSDGTTFSHHGNRLITQRH